MSTDPVREVLAGIGELVELVASDLDDAALERVVADLSAMAARADLHDTVFAGHWIAQPSTYEVEVPSVCWRGCSS